ncbi:DUF86 domain-containing protein [Thioalkalivibrio sp. ALM2T]|uniref:HepT-like ribonuclease domain-containing protein n=1 Tax=Thioalkalivibrio sp. ALM2T TaxID=1158184 RepID=UPI000367F760|nr:HepT-like ribonuclease domain-containing protein [Thioalkalivibrio sp. ALM2T]
MRRDPRACIWDAHEAANRVAEFIADATEHEYQRNALLRSAVERQLEILGEALGPTEKLDPALAREIPQLRSAVDLRNMLIHGYAKVDNRIVWNTACRDIPIMAKDLEHLLSRLGKP